MDFDKVAVNGVNSNVQREVQEEIFRWSIRIGILGYGNLGRGVECAIEHNPDS